MQDELKKQAAIEALKIIPFNSIIGVGSGSTVHYFIDALGSIKNKIKGAVASSIATEKKLKALKIPVIDLNEVGTVPIYIDGADEFNEHKYLIKGGGGALTREKILAASSKQFICIVDQSKQTHVLGKFPVAIEVIPMARGFVAREIVKLGGSPVYRAGFITDNGNIILDIFNLALTNPIHTEETLNNIAGAVCNGIFAKRPANKIIIATDKGIDTI